MKNRMTRLGYVFGTCVLFPLLLTVVNLIFFRGNGVKDSDITNYINNSKIDTVYKHGKTEGDSKRITVGLYKNNNGIIINNHIFYSLNWKKYINVITFEIGDDNPLSISVRHVCMYNKHVKLLVKINQQQLNDPAYGTKENPVPVFAMDLLDPPPPYQYGDGVQRDFHVSDKINRLFVKAYLNYVMSKEEFKRLFRK